MTLKAPKDIDPDMLAELEGMKPEVFENMFKLMHRPEATKEVESNKPWSSDQSVSTLGEQTDDVILAHLPEYVGSNILNSTINGAIIEEAQRSAEELMEVLTLDEDELAERDDLTSAIAMAAKDKAKSYKASRETSERIQEAVKADREEQRREEFLSRQNIDLGDGKSASALDIVNSMNKILANWDENFDEMVAQGIAQPQDRDRLKKAATKYRDMMDSQKLSDAEKQKRRDEMIQSGEITAEQMKYLDHKEKDGKEKSYIQRNEISKEQQIAAQKVSFIARKEDFAAENISNKKDTSLSLFGTASTSGIETNVKLTEAYNASATATPEPEKKNILAMPPVAPKVSTQAVSGDMAFG